MKLLFPSRERVIFKQEYIPKKRQAFQHQNFQTLWLDWIHVWHESILREGQTVHGTARDSNPCDSDKTDKEDRKTWPQIIHEQFLFFWWLGEETDLLLWECQAEQERHATRLKTEATKLKRGDIRVRTRADLTAILWRDKRDVCMLTIIHNAPAEGNFCNEGGKATNCDGL